MIIANIFKPVEKFMQAISVTFCAKHRITSAIGTMHFIDLFTESGDRV